MNRSEAEAMVKKHGSVRAAARNEGVHRTTIARALEKPVQASATGRKLSEFRATHDKSFIVPNKIRAALKELGAGWEYEVQFAKMAGVSLADLGNFRDQFSAYIVEVRRDSKRAWAGKVSTAKAMREMLT